jgi:ABC-type glutathione transport system ATPase component
LLYNIERRVNVSTVIEDKKVGDMTARELKSLIRDTIHELIDPVYGLELRPEIEEELRESLKSKKRTSAEKVASELGLKW